MGRSVARLGLEKDQRIWVHGANLAGIAHQEGPQMIAGKVHPASGGPRPTLDPGKVVGAQQARLAVPTHVPHAVFPPHTVDAIAPGAGTAGVHQPCSCWPDAAQPCMPDLNLLRVPGAQQHGLEGCGRIAALEQPPLGIQVGLPDKAGPGFVHSVIAHDLG